MSKTFSADRGSTRYRQAAAAGNAQNFAPTMPAAKQTISIATDNLVAIDPIDIDPKAMPFLTSDNHVSPETDVSSKYKKVIEFHSGHNSELPPAGTNILNLSKGDGSQKNTYNMAVACAAIGIGGNKVIYDENRSNLKPQIGDRATAIKDITSPAMPPKLIDVQQTTKIIGPPEPAKGSPSPAATAPAEKSKPVSGGEGEAPKSTLKGGGTPPTSEAKAASKPMPKKDGLEWPDYELTEAQKNTLREGKSPGFFYSKSLKKDWYNPYTGKLDLKKENEKITGASGIRKEILENRQYYADYKFNNQMFVSFAEFRFLYEPEFRKGIEILAKTVPKLRDKFNQDVFLAFALIAFAHESKQNKNKNYIMLKHGYWYHSHPTLESFRQYSDGDVASFSNCFESDGNARRDQTKRCRSQFYIDLNPGPTRKAPLPYAAFNSPEKAIIHHWYFRRHTIKDSRPIGNSGEATIGGKKPPIQYIGELASIKHNMNIEKVPIKEPYYNYKGEVATGIKYTFIATEKTYKELISDNVERKYVKTRSKEHDERSNSFPPPPPPKPKN
jgi:hypothetical protein